ncbi:MAG: hypothetical protein WC455_11700 [Dehalococcoidia bacterium]|jgi:hypothetical protein
MNKLQYKRWKEFATGMAKNYPNATERRRQRLLAEVNNWFGWHDDGSWKYYVSWDVSRKIHKDDRYSANLCCDIFKESFEKYNHYDEDCDRYEEGKFWTQLACCIRAGLDCAAEPKTGVIGFTISDLKSFFNESIPKWISISFGTNLNKCDPSESIWL